MSDEEVEDLLTDGRKQGAQFAHDLEVAALIESFGYNDRYAREKGFPDIFSMSEHLFPRLQLEVTSEENLPRNRKQPAASTEIRYAVGKFCLAIGYSIPWMALLALEHLRPDALRVSPELGGALSLSLIASLIMTGGFVQIICRRGNFYYGMKEHSLARSTCMSLLNLGLTSSIFLALLAMILGSYFHLFAGRYLVLAATNFLALSLLWMLCAVLSVQGIGWCILCIFVFSALISGLTGSLADWNKSALAVLWPWTATFCALGCVLTGFHREAKKHTSRKNSPRPRLGVSFISLIPFYVYGTAYFTFLFADRLTAGSATPWVSGLSFGIDVDYKQGMDLALLVFLITAAIVEYLADSFLRFWHRLARKLPQSAGERFIISLRRRHSQMMVVIFLSFVVTSSGAWFAFSHSSNLAPTLKTMQAATLGGLGYLMLSIALLESIILASVNAISTVVAALALGAGINLLTGYGFGHVWGVQYSAAGLLVGSAVVLWKCNAAVRQVISNAAYHYSVS
jgi:hypothetical protein